MRRIVCAFLLALFPLVGPTAELHAGAERLKAEKPAEPAAENKLRSEDREVIRMLELLQRMELMQDMELLEGKTKAGSEDKK